MRLSTLIAILALVEAPTAAARPRLAPASIPLESGAPIDLVVTGLEGRGRPAAASNVGRVSAVTERGDGVHLRLEPPAAASPQELCLVVWRQGPDPRPFLLRAPLLGRTLLPVRSRVNAEVTVRVGETRFGPVTTDWRGEAKVPILVPPGATEAQVEVTDRIGMATEKPVKVEQPPYNRLTLAVLRARGGLRLAAAVCGAGGRPEVTVDGAAVPLRGSERGLWERLWSPPPDFSELLVTVRGSLPGDPRSTAERAVPMDRGGVSLDAPATPTAGAAVRPGTEQAPAPVPTRRRRAVELQLGLAIGLLYNLGEVLGPHFGADAGVLYNLPRGRIGLVVSAGYSWTGLTVDGSAGAGDAESSVTLLPIGLGLTYQLPFGRLAPFATAGYLLQVTTTTTRASFLQERQRVDLASGGFGLVGAGYRIGPGSAVLQAGYLWSRVENVDVRLLAGGLVVGVGYRIRI